MAQFIDAPFSAIVADARRENQAGARIAHKFFVLLYASDLISGPNSHITEWQDGPSSTPTADIMWSELQLTLQNLTLIRRMFLK
jgi:hypothetical protein